MPFDWRRFLPYGIGNFIPKPAPTAPPPPTYQAPAPQYTPYSTEPITGPYAPPIYDNTPAPQYTPYQAPSAPIGNPYAPSADPTSINPYANAAGPSGITPTTPVAQQPVNQNPGSTGTASVDLGPAPTVAHLGGHAL